LKKINQYFLLLLLIPSIGEVISASKFSIPVPGSPFTLGRITFIFVGMVGISYNKKFYFNSDTLKGMIFIFLGGMIGALFSNQMGLSLSRSFGTLILFIASIGIAGLWQLRYFQKILDIFFILNLCYWSYYVFDLTISNGFSFTAYSKLFLDNEAVNHHVIGVNASVSSIYLAIRYFYSNNQLNLGGYLIIFIGLITCFLCESRSNLLLTIVTIIAILYFSKVRLFKIILITIPLFIVMFLLLTSIAEKNESLFQRFNATDEDYQERTTGMRFDFIEGFFDAFINNPFGKGIFGSEIAYGSHESTMVHNQYLTFILSGGIIALIGIYLWISEFVTVFKFTIKNKKHSVYDYAIVFSMFTFLITLLTIEYSGLLFFMYASLLINQSENYTFDKVSYFRRIMARFNG
jgi:hypothetical protein